ncbi:MAG TPA: alginate lyase family protein, partial [Candidatus Limnocylindrales bacterium]|nr:alginate lyase family protein [Candidatus Limnocylindrales bacterium]
SPLPSQAIPDHGGLVTLAELRERAAAARSGHEPEASAVRDLLGWAATAVEDRPKPKEPLKIGGTTGSFVDDTATAYGLALAWGVSDDPRYAEAARDDVRAWVQTTKTLEDACPDGGECQTSLIVSRVAPGFVFAMDLTSTAPGADPADDAAFRAWLTAVILPAASRRSNNWGDAGAFLRVAATDYLGDDAGLEDALGFWHEQLDRIEPSGEIPEETRRGSSGLSYTQEALLYRLAVARIAERRDVDLWDARGAGGGTLKAAVDLAARYQADPSGWPFGGRVDNPTVGPGWELAYAHWPEPAIAALIRDLRPFGADGHSAIRWTTLTNGIPIQP